ncbi:MAG: radical SAM protein [Ruminococcus sp.]|nr:radical SAM protein [Ruminococcus sp.]
MEKLTFSKLVIELTRRCNMNCIHCLRGEQQNIDIDNKYIDRLLDHTEIIEQLEFTGGETTLCIDKMNYILDGIKQRGIPVLQFSFVTNGLIHSNSLIDTIKRYSELVQICQKIGCNNENGYLNVIITVSFDIYHSNIETVNNNFYSLIDLLQGYAQVTKKFTGNYVTKEGRAKNFKYGKTLELDFCTKRRIELLDKKHKPLCPQWRTYRLIKLEQIIICCSMYLSAKGNLLTDAIGFHEYCITDNEKYIICHMSEDINIYNAILKYNIGKIDCLTTAQLMLDKAKKNPYTGLSDAMFTKTIDKVLGDAKDKYQIIRNKVDGELSLNNLLELELELNTNGSLIEYDKKASQEHDYFIVS